MKVELPKEISAKMKMWREGWDSFPSEYTDFHNILASKSLLAMVDRGQILLHKSWMASDGWGDGCTMLHAIIEETKTGKLVKIKWCDSNQDWFEACQGGGWGTYRLAQ